MSDATRPALVAGPYHPPKARVGDSLVCEARGPVTVVGFHAAPVRWPTAVRRGLPFLVLRGDLARAVRAESVGAVCQHFGVCPSTVWRWRKALGVSVPMTGRKPLRPGAPAWTAEEDALLGTARDAEVARLLGRTAAAVRQRRMARNLPSYVVPVDGRKLKRLREARGWTVAELTKRAGMTRGAIGYLEGGERRATWRDRLAKLARALGVGPDTLAASRG